MKDASQEAMMKRVVRGRLALSATADIPVELRRQMGLPSNVAHSLDIVSGE